MIWAKVLLFIGASVLSPTIFGQTSESFRIPNSGDSCNVVNLNFGGGENVKQDRAPSGPPGKSGGPGPIGPKGTKGQKGEVGPQGISPEINMAAITTNVMQALGAKSCSELEANHGISKTGYYLMRSDTSMQPVYNYCDFEIRTDVRSCEELITHLGKNFKMGYYHLRPSEPDGFTFCTHHRSCRDVTRAIAKSTNTTGGVFDIFLESLGKSVEVYCDLETDGGGWTVFQRRMDGSEDFYRYWDDYVEGFGIREGEFWLGLEAIHQFTKSGDYELRVDMMDWSGNTAYAKYSTFSFDSGATNYRLKIGGYSGTARNSPGNKNRIQFTTRDNDNDENSGINCAVESKGAWFYRNCHYSNPNGYYYKNVGIGESGITWYHWKGRYEYLKFIEMKFRKKIN